MEFEELKQALAELEQSCNCFHLELLERYTEHPIDKFNRLTSTGWRLNMITGEYYLPPVDPFMEKFL